MNDAVHLGYAVGSGDPVSVPLAHMAVTGQTQLSGKTTTLEAMAARAGVDVLAFVTKRGEASFGAARRIDPYFRDRADWQFVDALLSAVLQEKNKFLRPWIMKMCRTTRTLADVQAAVRVALRKATGISEGVYTQLDAYLDLIVPEIHRADLAASLQLIARSVSVMDVSSFTTPMQMLFVQSALDWVNQYNEKTVVVVPEAWEFIPEGKGSPAKASAVALVRKGAGIGNRIWVDSQDMAGVDKVILRGCAVWLIGVQREANEIKRNLANIPAGIKRPTAAAVATLERGQFYACWGTHAIKTFVQPAWMSAEEAQAHARGEPVAPMLRAQPPRRVATPLPPSEDETVNQTELQELRAENANLKRRIAELERVTKDAPSSNHKPAVDALRVGHHPTLPAAGGDVGRSPAGAAVATRLSNGAHADPFANVNDESLYQAFKTRLIAELPSDPTVMRVVLARPELRIEVERQVITADGRSVRGRIGRMIVDGFFTGSKTSADVLAELERTSGSRPSNIELGNELKTLVEMGFFTRENKWFTLVADMAVNVVER